MIAILTLSTILDKSYISVLGFLATILHELGHILAMKIKCRKIEEIQMNLFNFNIVDHSRNEKNFSAKETGCVGVIFVSTRLVIVFHSFYSEVFRIFASK